MLNIKEVRGKLRLHASLNLVWSMAAMLLDSVVVVVRTRPRAMLLAMKAMRKSTHGFPFLSYMGMGLRLATLRTAGATLKTARMPCDFPLAVVFATS